MNVIKLFDYQEDMKERIEKALRLHRSVMAQMPTGTGKTVLLASVVESFLREHSNCNVWIVAHRRELVSQIRETIQRVFFESPRPSLAKEGFFSKTHPQWSLHPLRFPRSRGTETSGSGDVTALLGAQNRYAIRLADHQRSTPYCAGWDRLGMNYYGKATSQLQRRHCSITSLLKSLVVSLL